MLWPTTCAGNPPPPPRTAAAAEATTATTAAAATEAAATAAATAAEAAAITAAAEPIATAEAVTAASEPIAAAHEGVETVLSETVSLVASPSATPSVKTHAAEQTFFVQNAIDRTRERNAPDAKRTPHRAHGPSCPKVHIRNRGP